MKKSKKPQGTGRAWIELDMGNLRHNVEVLRGLLPDGCQLMPAVKANAYGHGAVEISKELNAMGIRSFCVATVAEGIELRKNGIKGEILILGYTHPNDFHLIRKYRLMQTVIDYDYAKALNRFGKPVTVHLKIDTGMHRLGERCENFEEIMKIFQYKNLNMMGIYTHLCADNNLGREFTNRQIEAFYNMISLIKEHGFACPKIHIQNSYGLMNCPELTCDYARIGIALFGMLSNRQDTENFGRELRPVLSVKARIVTIKTLFAGEAAGYGLQFTAARDMKIATVSIGYADGISRSLSHEVGSVLVRGQRTPIIGRICMDQMLIDITAVPDVTKNDIAVIIGQDEMKQIKACEIAEWDGTIANEVLSRLGERLGRIVIGSCKLQRRHESLSS